jgi:protein TonB
MPLVHEGPDPLAAGLPAWALERRLGAAVIASLAVHAAAMSLSFPAARIALFEPAPVLEVSLRELVVPPAVSPEPAGLESAPPRPDKRAKPEPRRHEPVPLARKSEPLTLSPVRTAEEDRVQAPAREADVAAPTPPAQPAWPPLAAQVPAPRVPPAELLSSYGQTISQALARYKEYPPIAQMQGWQGSVTMQLRVTPSGRLLDAEVHTSSGHEVLDRQALAMASKAEPFPAPPEGLRDREIAVLVPVVFRLER